MDYGHPKAGLSLGSTSNFFPVVEGRYRKFEYRTYFGSSRHPNPPVMALVSGIFPSGLLDCPEVFRGSNDFEIATARPGLRVPPN